MKGDLGTILYIIFLLLFTVGGMLRKKKKVDAEERMKKLMQQQAAEAAETEEVERAVEEEPPLTTGNPLVDALLGSSRESYSFEEDARRAYDIEEEPREEIGGKEPEEFLPSEEEGKSVFSAKKKEEKKAPVDKNRIVADQPDWEKFMDEQNREERSDFLEDFDPVKAVIYSEIMERKYL